MSNINEIRERLSKLAEPEKPKSDKQYSRLIEKYKNEPVWIIFEDNNSTYHDHVKGEQLMGSFSGSYSREDIIKNELKTLNEVIKMSKKNNENDNHIARIRRDRYLTVVQSHHISYISRIYKLQQK